MLRIFNSIFLALFFTLLCYTLSFSQNNKDSIDSKKIYIFSGSTALIYTGTMYSLNKAWYSKYEHSSFHFFNDSREWLQMDKIGHAFSTYYLSNIMHKGFAWTGMNKNRSIILGTSMSYLAMISIEVFDGFSSKWGASLSDVTANLSGGLLYAGQELAFNKQIVRLKYSFHPSPWAKYRPDALGENNFQQIIKDYNGQTYWMSCNLKSLTGIKGMPKWLNVAFGYSGEEMLGGRSNLDMEWNLSNGDIPVRYRQYYFSLDADLSQIKVRNRFLTNVFKALNCLKIPFPTLILEKNKLKVNSVYF